MEKNKFDQARSDMTDLVTGRVGSLVMGGAMALIVLYIVLSLFLDI